MAEAEQAKFLTDQCFWHRTDGGRGEEQTILRPERACWVVRNDDDIVAVYSNARGESDQRTRISGQLRQFDPDVTLVSLDVPSERRSHSGGATKYADVRDRLIADDCN